MKIVTVGFLLRHNEICIALKKQKIGAGLYMGFGGHCEDKEDPWDCIIREGHEELTIELDRRYIRRNAFVNFCIDGKHDITNPYFRCHVFICSGWLGEPQETTEAKPAWFPLNQIPYDKMAQGDRIWLPRVLTGATIHGGIWYRDKTLQEVVRSSFEEAYGS